MERVHAKKICAMIIYSTEIVAKVKLSVETSAQNVLKTC